MKKIIVYLTILSLINFAGCYSLREISKEEFVSQEYKEDAVLLTKKMETYKLEEARYIIKYDSIYGMGSKLLDDGTEQPMTQSIPLDDVEVFNLEEANVLETALLTLGIASIVAVFGLIVLAASMD